MKTLDKKAIIVGATTLVVGLLAGWLIFGGNRSNSRDDHEQVKTEVNGEAVWTCSMHPQVRQNEPGDCPICGMDLIPVEGDNNSDIDPDAISMSPTAMQLASISTAIVGGMHPVKQVRLNGKVQFDERLVYSQSSHIPGRIEKLLVNFTGEFVNKGQTIAYVYAPELVTAQVELFEAQKIAESQPQLFASAKEKLKNWKLSDKQIDEILNSGKTLEEFPVQAEVAGYVTSKMINPGDYVGKGGVIYEIANLSKVWILFDVYESDMVWVKKGDKVEFSISSLPGENFEGVISYLDPVIDPKTRVAKARVEYNNANGKLKPEMFVSGVAEAKLTKKSNSLVVPKTAVMWTGKRSVVYIKSISDQGVNFIMREVTLGPSLGDSYVVENGLREGEEIAVNGTFSIDAAAQLAGKPSMMSPSIAKSSEGKPGGGQATTGHNHASLPDGQRGSTKGDGLKEKNTSAESQSFSLNSKAKETLQPLYTAYLKWKNALVEDNFEAAQKMATNMKSALDKIDMGMFKGNAHSVWMDYQGKLRNSLQHVQHFSDIEELRNAFQTVSANMVEMADIFNPPGGTIYVQHCPMADNNKGADWLSTEKEIRNPYYGSSMLTCGEITKEIK
ncbi:MAG: efflux RND transporter periplasmic adaptor subunit [Bacteroidales bacterium]